MAIGHSATKIICKTGEKVVTTGQKVAVGIANHITDNIDHPEESNPQTIQMRVIQGEARIGVREARKNGGME